jgi:hypothetical protein
MGVATADRRHVKSDYVGLAVRNWGLCRSASSSDMVLCLVLSYNYLFHIGKNSATSFYSSGRCSP